MTPRVFMHEEQIKAAIRMRGATLSELAGRIGVTPAALGMAIRTRSSERIENAIAAFLEQPAREIWPDRFDERGNRVRFRAVSAANAVAA